MNDYNNTDLWKRDGDASGKRYVSVPTARPSAWTRSYRASDGRLLYASGDYLIVRWKAGGPYTVYRKGVELPLSFTSLLVLAKARAVRNAAGEDRMHVA